MHGSRALPPGRRGPVGVPAVAAASSWDEVEGTPNVRDAGSGAELAGVRAGARSARRRDAVILRAVHKYSPHVSARVVVTPTDAWVLHRAMFRRQHPYDHRLRALGHGSGDLRFAAEHGVPRSTARAWLGASPPDVSLTGTDTYDTIALHETARSPTSKCLRSPMAEAPGYHRPAVWRTSSSRRRGPDQASASAIPRGGYDDGVQRQRWACDLAPRSVTT